MKFKTELLFPTPIWIFEDCPIDNKSIIDFVHEVREEDPKGMAISNEGGWQSRDFVMPYVDNTPLGELNQHVTANCYTAADSFGYRDYNLRLSNMWMNVNTKGHYNHIHNHPGSIFAGVYYAAVPDCCCGELKFLRSLQEQCLKESWGCHENFDRYEEQHNYTTWYVQPNPGTMVIFPAWLMHSVDKSATDKERISLSFNIHCFSDYYREDEIYPKKRGGRKNVPLSLK